MPPTDVQARPRFIERILLRFSDVRLVDGLWVGAIAEEDCDALLRRVETALGIIRTYDPHRYDRLRRDLERVWVRVQTRGNTGRYNVALRTCELDPRYLRREDVGASDIASVIVHEATHARLRRCDSSQPFRNRIEAACRRQELTFSLRLPQPDGDKIRDKVKRMDQVPDDFWSDASHGKRHRLGVDEALRYLGTPGWLTRPIRVIQRIVRAVARFASGLTRACC
jgi:hypothetical protein